MRQLRFRWFYAILRSDPSPRSKAAPNQPDPPINGDLNSNQPPGNLLDSIGSLQSDFLQKYIITRILTRAAGHLL